jgi:biopolymer transport protein ExbB/TolQ
MHMVNVSSNGRLSWTREDVEQRCGVRGGRFTQTNTLLTFCIAVLLTVIAYAAMLPYKDRYFVQMFTERGAVQYVTVLCGFWALTILAIKSLKIRLQRKPLTHSVTPQDPDFVLSSATAADVLASVHATCDDSRAFILFNRIEIALSNLRNMGRVSDLADVFHAQAQHDEDVMESSYSLVRGLVWAIPVLGFIGTVQGLSAAVGSFGSVLTESAEVSALKPALRGVTAGLATAFETTFVALVIALGIQLLLTFVKRAEEQLLDDCKEYCQRQLLGRLRILPFEQVANR